MPRLCECNPGICLTAEGKARENLSQGSRRDGEDLAKETEWMVQHKRNAKKRKVGNSCNTPKQPTSEQHQQQPKHEAAKPPKPPPIIIYQVPAYDVVYNYLNTKVEHSFRITLLNSGDLKLNVDTERSL